MCVILDYLTWESGVVGFEKYEMRKQNLIGEVVVLVQGGPQVGVATGDPLLSHYSGLWVCRGELASRGGEAACPSLSLIPGIQPCLDAGHRRDMGAWPDAALIGLGVGPRKGWLSASPPCGSLTSSQELALQPGRG